MTVTPEEAMPQKTRQLALSPREQEEGFRYTCSCRSPYLIIDLAYKGSLAGIGDEIHDYTFPAELDDKVREKITELNRKLEALKE